MEDGAPVHKARISEDWQNSKGIKKILWPAQSPDLNPIENLWKILKHNIQQIYQQKSIPEMERALQSAWDDFSRQTLKNLIDSMPNCMQAVIKANGGSTQW